MKAIWVFLFVILTCTPTAWGDSLACDGHVAGEHFDITLTPFQRAAMSAGSRQLALTAEQRTFLARMKPSANGVRSLTIFRPDVETCCCELANVGLLVSRSTVEVAAHVLGRDLDAELKRIWTERLREEEERYNREGTTGQSIDVRLMKRGEALHYANDNVGAITLLEQARRINPKLRSAIFPLLNAYGARTTELRKLKRFREARDIAKKKLYLIEAGDNVMRPAQVRRVCTLTAETARRELEIATHPRRAQ